MIRLPSEREGSGLGDLVADLTPMLDVLFILLVFFVLTANSAQIVLDLKLPQDAAAAAKAPPEKRVVVAVHAADRGWTVDGTPHADWDEASAAIDAAHAANPDAKMVVAGDRDATVDLFLKTLSHLRSLGLTETDILMEPK